MQKPSLIGLSQFTYLIQTVTFTLGLINAQRKASRISYEVYYVNFRNS